jgi:hypothetical protein
MTASTAVSLIALSLGNVVRERGAQVLKKAPPSGPENKVSGPPILQVLYSRWFDVSSLARFFVSGNLGNICFFFIERFIFVQLTKQESLPEFVANYKETVSFFVGYLLQIITQHFLHAVLVYGLETINTREKYFKTLLGQFYAYGIALFGSTALNLSLISSGLDKTVAFFSTMVIFACINYYLVGWLMKQALGSATEAEASAGRKGTRSLQKSNKNAATTARGSAMKVGTKKDEKLDAIRRIRRGGAFGLVPQPGISFLSPQSIHQLVLETGTPLEVDSINDQ